MLQGNLGHAGTAPKVGVSPSLGVLASVLWICKPITTSVWSTGAPVKVTEPATLSMIDTLISVNLC